MKNYGTDEELELMKTYTKQVKNYRAVKEL